MRKPGFKISFCFQNATRVASLRLGGSQSFRLATLATLSVGSVATSFIAFAVLRGWYMGIIEAVCTMVLVGLSIDYILHVAGAYVRTPAGPR